jgi:hypothetical protein
MFAESFKIFLLHSFLGFLHFFLTAPLKKLTNLLLSLKAISAVTRPQVSICVQVSESNWKLKGEICRKLSTQELF